MGIAMSPATESDRRPKSGRLHAIIYRYEAAVTFKPVRVGIGPIANQVADTGNAYCCLEAVRVSYDPVGNIPAIASSRNAQPFRVSKSYFFYP